MIVWKRSWPRRNAVRVETHLACNIYKAAGDDIPSWILRYHAFTLAHPICIIFNDLFARV